VLADDSDGASPRRQPGDRGGEDVVAELAHVTHRGVEPEAGGMPVLKGAYACLEMVIPMPPATPRASHAMRLATRRRTRGLPGAGR